MLWIIAYNPHTAAPNLLLTLVILEKKKNRTSEEFCNMQRFCSNSKLLILAVFSDLLAFFTYEYMHCFFTLHVKSFILKHCAQVSTPLVKGSFTPSIELGVSFGGGSAFFRF